MQFNLQTSNSPDLDLCDLIFFRSLDAQVSYLKDNCCHGIAELMEAVEAGFGAYDLTKLENEFGHLFATFKRILDHQGGNDFKSPHDHVRENIAAGRPLSYVGMNIPQVNALKDVVKTLIPTLLCFNSRRMKKKETPNSWSEMTFVPRICSCQGTRCGTYDQRQASRSL